MTSESAGPPWMAYHPDGSIHISGVPDRLLHHPEMQRRGIRLAYALKPGVVFRAAMDGPQFVVKVVDLDTEELPISRRLRGLSSPRNHAVPCEIYDDEHPLLIMPYLAQLYSLIVWDCPSLDRLLEIFQDLAEGVDFLHQQHIAHLDICYGNVVAALSQHVAEHPSLVIGRTYIIDFDTSRQLALGPGSQHAIALPPTQIRPPNGLKHFDPYSWDVYCLGQLYKKLIKDFSFVRQYSPRIAHWYAQWLIGDERGCHTPCRCRPTARTVCRVLSMLRVVSPIIEVCERLYDRYFVRSPTRP
ncbi:hypothetical protein GY45DRAFT_1331878 [Cubamyces sp. BRFM 1775]|nr:hypothetical protein GY45DRAFT_1331878 [Cubamyces sp. BRFM 1775]